MIFSKKKIKGKKTDKDSRMCKRTNNVAKFQKGQLDSLSLNSHYQIRVKDSNAFKNTLTPTPTLRTTHQDLRRWE